MTKRPNPVPPLPTLPLHLMMSMGCWLSSPFALQHARNGSPRSSPDPASDPLAKAVADEAKKRASNLLSGVLKYVEAPYARDVEEPPAIWKKGNARLLDYGLGVCNTARVKAVALFVPSLINRYYILDLEEERSLLRYLAREDIYPLVLDWGKPGKIEQEFNCGDYITEILNPAIDHIHEMTGEKIALAGYCMGGVFALAAAQLKQSKISKLALLATPWDFHCKAFAPFIVAPQWRAMMASMLRDQKQLPAEIIQSLFYMTDPWVFEQKFRRYASLDARSREAKDFIALEHWVNDGVPMTANVAHDCLIGWAQDNSLPQGRWKIGGKAIDPRKLKMPAFIALPQSDHVVPRDCALPLASAISNSKVVYPGAGHVGMIVGSKAKVELWQPLADWITLSI